MTWGLRLGWNCVFYRSVSLAMPVVVCAYTVAAVCDRSRQ
jgi:hypothetical protein